MVNTIIERMRPLVPVSARPRFRERLIVTAAMITNSLATFDRLTDDHAQAEVTFRDLLVMAKAALCADAETT